jgi:hypothetical protein
LQFCAAAAGSNSPLGDLARVKGEVKYENWTNELQVIFKILGVPFNGSLGVRARSLSIARAVGLTKKCIQKNKKTSFKKCLISRSECTGIRFKLKARSGAKMREKNYRTTARSGETEYDYAKRR